MKRRNKRKEHTTMETTERRENKSEWFMPVVLFFILPKRNMPAPIFKNRANTAKIFKPDLEFISFSETE